MNRILYEYIVRFLIDYDLPRFTKNLLAEVRSINPDLRMRAGKGRLTNDPRGTYEADPLQWFVSRFSPKMSKQATELFLKRLQPLFAKAWKESFSAGQMIQILAASREADDPDFLRYLRSASWRRAIGQISVSPNGQEAFGFSQYWISQGNYVDGIGLLAQVVAENVFRTEGVLDPTEEENERAIKILRGWADEVRSLFPEPDLLKVLSSQK